MTSQPDHTACQCEADLLREQARLALEDRETLREENHRLRMALRWYGEHQTGCVKGDRCNCGFDAALGVTVARGSGE